MVLTGTHGGDGILLANDVLPQSLLQGEAAPFLSLTLPLLLLVLQGEGECGSESWAQKDPAFILFPNSGKNRCGGWWGVVWVPFTALAHDH